MMGLPTETPDEMAETLALHWELAPDDFGFFVFYPYPGTQLHRYCMEHGLLPEDFLDRPAHHRTSVLHLPTLTPEDIRANYERWTAVRAERAVERSGPVTAAVRNAVVAQVEHCASVG
jgi:anaerobic magnesium-protoporphyrin IX monomethyl ester cyclase